MKELPLVTWESIAADDFIYKLGDYCLRVEQMDEDYWWWMVYYRNNEIAFDEPTAATELEAKLLAELCFIRHYAHH